MEFLLLENASSPFCRTEWFHIHVTRVFGLLVKVIGSFAIDPGLILASWQLRQNCVVGQKFQILSFFKI